MGNEEFKHDLTTLNNIINEKNNKIDSLNQELFNQKQINDKTKDYLLTLESKVAEFDKQKELINSLNSQISQLKKDISRKDDEINSLKKEFESSKLIEEYIMKMFDLRKNLDEI